MSYQIYKAKLKNELTPSRKKTQFFSYYIIFLLSSKLSDLRPWSQNNVILTNKITSLQISLLIQLSRWYISLSNIEKLIVLFSITSSVQSIPLPYFLFRTYHSLRKTLSILSSFCIETFSINCSCKYSNLLVEERQTLRRWFATPHLILPVFISLWWILKLSLKPVGDPTYCLPQHLQDMLGKRKILASTIIYVKPRVK